MAIATRSRWLAWGPAALTGAAIPWAWVAALLVILDIVDPGCSTTTGCFEWAIPWVLVGLVASFLAGVLAALIAARSRRRSRPLAMLGGLAVTSTLWAIGGSGINETGANLWGLVMLACGIPALIGYAIAALYLWAGERYEADAAAGRWSADWPAGRPPLHGDDRSSIGGR